MSLLDEARAAQRHHGPQCTIALLRSGERGKEIDELLAAVKEGLIYSSTAERILKQNNLPVNAEPIRRHIRGECSCDAA